MSQQLFYCSELSRNAGEQVFGTASTGETWLLVEYPYPWGSRALEDSSLSLEVKAHLNNLLKTIPRARLLLIKQSQPRAGVSVFVVRARARRPFAVRLTITDYEDLRAINFAAIASGDSLEGGELTREPMHLVCTHGKRDKCCAKFGNAIYNSMRARYGSQVWQSSHVGGDRFAANVVTFPHGLFYGHVAEDAAARIADQYARGQIVVENFRGRACYSHAAQAAECFVRAETSLVGIDDLKLASVRRVSETSWSVRFDGTDGKIYEARVASRVSEFRTFLTCKAGEPKSIASFVLEELRSFDEATTGDERAR